MNSSSTQPSAPIEPPEPPIAQPKPSLLLKLGRSIPIALVVLRFLLGPALLGDAADGQTSDWFVLGLVAAFLSDILDGVIARRLGISTAQLRQADSWADLSFYSCIAASTWLVHPDVVLAFRIPLLLVLAAQVGLYGLSWLRFSQFPSYHTYTAKAWGITLFVATVSLFGFQTAGLGLWLAVIMGLINSLEEIAMTLVLPEWRHDVLSLIHALHSLPAS